MTTNAWMITLHPTDVPLDMPIWQNQSEEQFYVECARIAEPYPTDALIVRDIDSVRPDGFLMSLGYQPVE